MSDSWKKYAQDLAEIRKLIAGGQIADAERALAAVDYGPDIFEREERTELGYPFGMHALKIQIARAKNERAELLGLSFFLTPDPGGIRGLSPLTIEDRIRIAQANRENVPRSIHQIWIGPRPPPETAIAWEAYAAAHNCPYTLWLEQDLRRIGVYDHPAFNHFLARRDFPAAVDVARYMVLQKFGGLYLDCDWYPIRKDVSLFDVFPMQGFAALAAGSPRGVGGGSYFLTNSLLAAPPGHPVLNRLVDILPEAIKRLPNAPAWWIPGPVLLTMAAKGSVTVIDSGLVCSGTKLGDTLDAVEQVAAQKAATTSALLLAWKPWRTK